MSLLNEQTDSSPRSRVDGGVLSGSSALVYRMQRKQRQLQPHNEYC